MINLARKGKTLSMEINNYFKDAAKREDRVSKQAFSKQRMNLNPEVFVILNNEYIQSIYNSSDHKTLNGYIITAIDGTVMEIPDTSELRKTFDCEKTENGIDHCAARARTSTIYDVMNNIVIDAQINKYTASEKELGLRNILNMVNLLPDEKVMIIFDRGYVSAELMLILTELQITFLCRVPKGRYEKEKKIMQSNDESIIFELDKNRKRRLSKEVLEQAGNPKELNLRMTKVLLETGETECLISNIPFTDFTSDEMGSLYFERWKIETAYDIAKNKLKIENFSGRKQITIEQEFYAHILLLNMIEDLKNDANRNLEKKGKSDLKYEYKINMNIFIGTFREYLIGIALEKDPVKNQKLYCNLIEEATENLVPIKPGRSFPRKFKRVRTKYPTNLRPN
jgi:hypothetical protein